MTARTGKSADAPTCPAPAAIQPPETGIHVKTPRVAARLGGDPVDTTTQVIIVAAVLAAIVLVFAIGILVRLVRARRELRRVGLPTGPRWVFWGAVLYFVLPVDLLPDPVYLDDIGVLLLALRTVRGSLGERERSTARRPDHQTAR
ncbi:hypothetical protein GCM10023086_60910 [Streptomyces venetus]|uniref:DUF1232 domain-containing protein n=1 Tax=Streptomyces venetus TaxID=1701086 RepID=A0ABP8GWA7_9ACTN